jgi:hypothetical protein
MRALLAAALILLLLAPALPASALPVAPPVARTFVLGTITEPIAPGVTWTRWEWTFGHSGAATYTPACGPVGGDPAAFAPQTPALNTPDLVTLIRSQAPCPPGSVYTLILSPWTADGVYGPPVFLGPYTEVIAPRPPRWPRPPLVTGPYRVGLPLLHS